METIKLVDKHQRLLELPAPKGKGATRADKPPPVWRSLCTIFSVQSRNIEHKKMQDDSVTQFRHIRNVQQPRVRESYCSICGMFVAASPQPLMLELAERIHVCATLTFTLPHDIP